MTEVPPKRPKLVHFFPDYDFDGDLDVLSYVKACRVYKKQQELFTLGESKKKTKRPFQNRMVNAKKDPMTSTWWRDYVVDENGTLGDPSHRDGKLFELRFFLPMFNIHELVVTIKKLEYYFWKSKADAFGRAAHRFELLVLGSQRILTRNCTVDDLYEQTYISAEVHRAFFHRFMP